MGKTKRSRQRRNTLLFLLLTAGLVCSPKPASASTIPVSTYQGLCSAIEKFNEGTYSEDTVIELSSSIKLTGDLPKITGCENYSLTIVGGTIDGDNQFRGLTIDTGETNTTVTVDSVSFHNCVVQGGAGGSGLSGGGGGMGAGGAIYAASGSLELNDVKFTGNTAQGGAGGLVHPFSNVYGGGGGLSGNGGGDAYGSPSKDSVAGNGGNPDSNGTLAATNRTAGNGGGEEGQEAYKDGSRWIGGDGDFGAGGGGSTSYGGDGGYGGGGGAGGPEDDSVYGGGGNGGFGGGGGGSLDKNGGGAGGFAAGNGGSQSDVSNTILGGGVGGGGAGLGGALFVNEGANVTIHYSSDATYSGNKAVGGNAGVIYGTTYNGNAQSGEGIGNAIFLRDDLAFDIDNGATLTVDDSMGGYSGATQNAEDYDDVQTGGIVKNGDGTLLMKAESSYSGDTTVNQGTLKAAAKGAISQYSDLVLNSGTVELFANQSVENLRSQSHAETDNSASVSGQLNLNGYQMTVSEGGNGSEVYTGTILDATGKGSLVKTGKGDLVLAGDSRGTTINSSQAKNLFTTRLTEGTLQLNHVGALGDGTLLFQEDVYDAAEGNALQFGNAAFDEYGNAKFANNITLSGKQKMRIGAAADVQTPVTLTLSGVITPENSNASGALIMKMNRNDQVLKLTQTGVDVNTETGAKTYRSSLANSMKAVELEQGTLRVQADQTTGGNWYSALGKAIVKNQGEGTTLQIVAESLGDTGNVTLTNNLELNQGLLSLTNDRNQNLFLSGNVSGAGGFNVDLNQSANIVSLTGNVNHTGTTLLTNGQLDVSKANKSQSGSVNLAGLASAEGNADAVVTVGQKSLVVGNQDDQTYSGIITDVLGQPGENGVKIVKQNTGTWTLELKDNGAGNGSHVDGITVNNGFLGLNNQNGLDTVGIVLDKTGGIDVLAAAEGAPATHVTLNKLNATQSGTILRIDDGSTLTLSNQNVKTLLGSQLQGSGTLELQNVINATSGEIQAWKLSGNNSPWSGLVDLAENGTLKTGSSNALNSKMTLKLQNKATLHVLNNNTLGTLQLSQDGTTTVASGKTLSIQKELKGSDTWTLNGAGTVVLKNGVSNEFYTGKTLVDGATLQVVGSNTATTRGDTTLTNGGTLVLDYSGVSIPVGSNWGSERILVQGAGNINVTNTSSALWLDNTLAFADSEDDSENQLGMNVALPNASVRLNGRVEGKGNLVKTGAGTLILDFADPATFEKAQIETGILQLGTDALSAAQLSTSDIEVGQNAALTGYSTVFDSLFVKGQLSLNAKNAVTLNAESGKTAFQMNTGSDVALDVVDSTTYTHFTTENGNIVLNGGTFHVTVENEQLLSDGDSFDIFHTENGALSANLSHLKVVDNLLGKRFVMSKDSKNFALTLAETNFSDQATTWNTMSVGQELNRWADTDLSEPMSQFFNELEVVSGNHPDALQQLTGEVRYSAMGAQMLNRAQLRQAISSRTTPRASSTNSSLSVLGQMPDGGSAISGWMSAYGMTGDVSGNKGTSGYDYGLLGGILGVELGSNDTHQLGLFYNYSNSEAETHTNLGSVQMNENLFGTYVRWNDGWGYGLASGSLGVSDYKTARSYELGSYSDTLNSKQDGWSGSAYLERGYTFELPRLNLQPFGGLQYTFLHQGSFSETAFNQPNLSLSGQSTDLNSLQSVLGVRTNKSWALLQRLVDLSVYASWNHEFLDTCTSGYATFNGQPGVGSMRIVGNNIGRDYFMMGGGGNWYLTDHFQVYGSCDLQLNDYVETVSGTGGLQFTW